MALSAHTRSVITGAASGLGRAFALRLAQPGAHVLVSDVDAEGGAETVRLVEEKGAQARYFGCDVRDPKAVEALKAEADRWMGGTDLLINNAGIAAGGQFEDISLEDWTLCIDIDLWGVVHGCRTFVPDMIEQGRGYVINVASAAGLLCAPLMSPYNVAKAGVVALTETLHAEYSGKHVNFSVLCPTFFQTGIADAGRIPPHMVKTVKRLMRTGRLSADDVARIALGSVAKNQLYSVPMRDGRTMWRAKRMSPGTFTNVLRSVNWLGRRLPGGR